jgi:hypothetical protein
MTSKTQKVTKSNSCNFIVFISVIDRFAAVLRYARSEPPLSQIPREIGKANTAGRDHNHPGCLSPVSTVPAYRKFESISLQGGVCKRSVPRELLSPRKPMRRSKLVWSKTDRRYADVLIPGEVAGESGMMSPTNPI